MESYSGAHPESIEELLEWPYRRFIAAYTAWRKRKLTEEWEQKKTDHVMALYANTNMDIPENKRSEKILEIEEHYNKVIDAINGESINEIQDHEMSDDEKAFMSAAKRGQQMVLPPVMPGEDSIGRLPG